MLKVLKAKMFRMIKELTDRFLMTTRWRHLLDYFEKSLNKLARSFVCRRCSKERCS